MKLLYILSEYLPDSGGGIISHYARILPGLVERGHEVTVVLASKDKLDHADYEIDGVRVRPLKSEFLERYANRFERWVGLDIFYYLLPVAWAAWAQAQENFDFDVVEVTDWALLFLPWMAAEKRAPVVVSLHGSCGQVDWFGKGEPRSLDGDLIRMVEALALRRADVVHANSRANAEFWQEKTGREILVIPPAYGGGTKADLTTEDTEVTETAVGPCLDKPSGALFSNPFTSELARVSENTLPTRSAIGPAGAAEPPRADGGGSIAPKDRETTKCTKGHEKGEEVSTTDSTDEHGLQKRMATPGEPGLALSFQNPFTSELARVSENTSPTRSAIGPAGAAEPLRADAGGLISDGTEFPKALDSEPSSLDSSSPATSYSPPATAPQALKGLVVGRLQNWKGAEVLCKALRLAPEIEIEWAGVDTDWGSTGLKASEYLAANYPDVFGKKLHWIGRLERDQVTQKMKVAGFLVVPSVWDVFNLTVAEGREAGLPVICSSAAGAEMLIQDGVSGFLFDPAKPEELAGHLKRILEMSAVDRSEMEHKAQEAVKTYLNEEKILTLLNESYIQATASGFSAQNDTWLSSLLFPKAAVEPAPQLGVVARAIRKLGRLLANA